MGASDGAVTAYIASAFDFQAGAYDIVVPDSNDFSMSENTSKTPIVLFDGQHIPEPAHSCDITLFSYVLHHAANNTQILLQEAKRVTKPRGYVLIAEDVAHPSDPTRTQAALANRPLHHDAVFRSWSEWRQLFKGPSQSHPIRLN